MNYGASVRSSEGGGLPLGLPNKKNTLCNFWVFFLLLDIFYFDSVVLADFGVGAGGWADGTGLSGAVDSDEAKAWPVALAPLEVIEERPMKVASDVNAVGNSAMNSVEGFFYEEFPAGVCCIGQAAFGDIDGLVIFFQVFEYRLDGFGFHIPP